MTDEEREAIIRVNIRWADDETKALLRRLDASRARVAEMERQLAEARKDAGHWHQLFGQASGEFDQAETEREAAEARVATLEAAILALANAADEVGVRLFDTDDMPEEVQRVQSATLNAREALAAPAAPRATEETGS